MLSNWMRTVRDAPDLSRRGGEGAARHNSLTAIPPRAHYFRLLLFLAIPIPPAALDRVTVALQNSSTWMPGLDIRIAPQCGSIRFGIFLVIVVPLLLHLHKSEERAAIARERSVPA